jgi:hypothetical protein
VRIKIIISAHSTNAVAYVLLRSASPGRHRHGHVAERVPCRPTPVPKRRELDQRDRLPDRPRSEPGLDLRPESRQPRLGHDSGRPRRLQKDACASDQAGRGRRDAASNARRRGRPRSTCLGPLVAACTPEERDAIVRALERLYELAVDSEDESLRPGHLALTAATDVHD